jgi:hypothetical protein
MWASLCCSCVRGDSEEDSNRMISFMICQVPEWVWSQSSLCFLLRVFRIVQYSSECTYRCSRKGFLVLEFVLFSSLLNTRNLGHWGAAPFCWLHSQSYLVNQHVVLLILVLKRLTIVQDILVKIIPSWPFFSGDMIVTLELERMTITSELVSTGQANRWQLELQFYARNFY